VRAGLIDRPHRSSGAECRRVTRAFSRTRSHWTRSAVIAGLTGRVHYAIGDWSRRHGRLRSSRDRKTNVFRARSRRRAAICAICRQRDTRLTAAAARRNAYNNIVGWEVATPASVVNTYLQYLRILTNTVFYNLMLGIIGTVNLWGWFLRFFSFRLMNIEDTIFYDADVLCRI